MLLLVVAVSVSYVLTGRLPRLSMLRRSAPKQVNQEDLKQFTLDELALYNGKDESLPVYVAIQ